MSSSANDLVFLSFLVPFHLMLSIPVYLISWQVNLQVYHQQVKESKVIGLSKRFQKVKDQFFNLA